MHQAWLGTILLAASATCYSTSGFFTRLVETDAPTMLFCRGVVAGLFLSAIVAWRERGHVVQSVRAIGRDGLLIVLCSALATVCFLNALRLSTVADVMVIDAAGPLVTAGFAWLFIGERADRTTMLATLVALAGVALMAGPAVAEGRMVGNLLAFAMVVLMSMVIVLMRRNPGISMLPAVALSAFLCALFVLPWARPSSVSGEDMVRLVLFGTTQFGMGLLLLSLGTPLVSATRGALIGTLQTPLGTFWVWLAFAEMPATATLLGGLVVLAAVTADIVLPRRKTEASARPT